MRSGTRILVVEDDPAIGRLLQLELEHRGLAVRWVTDGQAALDAVAADPPDAIFLDILLPRLDGEGVLARLRRAGTRIPVLMVTARDSSRDKIRNLETGADDYITKPFDIDELVARLGAVLRRVEPTDLIRVGDLRIDVDAHAVHRGDDAIELTAREYDLLLYLARNAGHVVTRDQILDRVWDSPDVDPNVLDVYIGYLRRKLDGPDREPLIRTVRGVGYALRSA